MAKQRRPPKPTKASHSAPSQRSMKPARPNMDSSAAGAPAVVSALPVASSPPPPQRRTTYFEAVSVYERGLEALQRHDYAAAQNFFNSVLRQYPEEKELHER